MAGNCFQRHLGFAKRIFKLKNFIADLFSAEQFLFQGRQTQKENLSCTNGDSSFKKTFKCFIKKLHKCFDSKVGPPHNDDDDNDGNDGNDDNDCKDDVNDDNVDDGA